MTLTTARDIVRRRLKSGNDTDRYGDNDIDDAILLVGNDFVNRTSCTLTASIVPLVSGSDAVSFSALTDFRPERLKSIAVNTDSNYTARDVAGGMQVTDLAAIRRRQGECTSTGTPALIGFTDRTAAAVHPTPKANGTATVWWTEPFVTFTPGTGTPDSVALNIPADLIYPVLIYGATVIVQLTEVEQIEKALRSGAYNAHVLASTGRGGLAPQVIEQDRPSWP
jgi:hypothetical protein